MGTFPHNRNRRGIATPDKDEIRVIFGAITPVDARG
jgi:hypothetical protein